MIVPFLFPLLLGVEEPLDVPHPPRTQSVKEGPAEALLREAKTLRWGQRWFEAAQAYRKFLVAYPDSDRIPDARFWLAATLEQDQRWEEAAKAYTLFLQLHPDQRLLGREARLNRIRCWGIVQTESRPASSGLAAALGDEAPEVRVAAALQLAKSGDRRAVDALRQGLRMPTYADACSLALVNLGIKPQPAGQSDQPRFLVIRIKEAGKPEPVTIRIALSLARAVGNYLSDEQLRQAKSKGVDLSSLKDQALSLPKGSVLCSVEDAKSTITITVE